MLAFNDIVLSKEATHFLTWLNAALELVLLLRLLTLKLRSFLGTFFLLLLVDLVGLSLSFAMAITGSWLHSHLDYRLVYLVLIALEALISLFMVYQLLRSITTRYPGIHRLAMKTLLVSIAVAIAIGFLSFIAEVREQAPSTQSQNGPQAPGSKAGEDAGAGADDTWLKRAVVLTVDVDQTVSCVLLLVLVSMLVFFLWFPIQLARNTAVFAAGYVVFFAVKSLTLFVAYFSTNALPEIGILTLVVSAACYLYWLVSLTRAGEAMEITVGHRWKPQEQERLLGQLGAINATILRSTRSPKLN